MLCVTLPSGLIVLKPRGCLCWSFGFRKKGAERGQMHGRLSVPEQLHMHMKWELQPTGCACTQSVPANAAGVLVPKVCQLALLAPKVCQLPLLAPKACQLPLLFPKVCQLALQVCFSPKCAS